MSFQAGQGRSYKYLQPSVQPLYEFGSGVSYTTFQLQPDPGTALKLGPEPQKACVAVTNTGAYSIQYIWHRCTHTVHINCTYMCYIYPVRVGTRPSPVVVTLFSSTTRGDLGSQKATAGPINTAASAQITGMEPRLIPNRQLIAFDKVHTTPQQKQTVCMDVRDADLAMVDDAGSHVAYAGRYTLTFFDGVSKVALVATIPTTRTVATIPAVDNPQPPCCMGSQTSCC